MKQLILALCLVFAGVASATDFSYLEFKSAELQSNHAVPLRIARPSGFEPAGPVHHQPKFNDLPFNVSLAAYIGDQQFIMVHAEVLSDGSGRIDYGELPVETLSGVQFQTRAQCAELSAEVIAEEHDLRFIADAGFAALPAVYLKQFLKIADDRNAELIISVGQRVADCDDHRIDAGWKGRFDQKIQELLSLAP